MLLKQHRLKKKTDFRRTYQRGKSLAYPSFVLYYRSSRLPEHRIGFSVSKKLGGAVERNRVKRRFREVCRLHNEIFLPHTDYIFILRNPAKTASKELLEKQIREALSRTVKK